MHRKLVVALPILAVLLWLGTPALQGQAGGKGKKVDDQTFVKKAAMGGLAEVMLGKLAEQHAKSADVKKFGQRMVKDHTMANKELIEIAAKNSFNLPKGVGKEHKEMADKLAKLEGAEFDRAYMKHMVKDHEEDAEEFAEAAKTLKNADLKAFAAKTLPVIQEHLKLAKQINSKLGGASTGK